MGVSFKKRGSETLTADGTPYSFVIDSSNAFRRVLIQVIGSTAGDAISLEGSLDGTNWASVGQLANGTFGPLAADGFLCYAWQVPILLRVSYTCALIPPPGVAPVAWWQMSEDTSLIEIGR